LPILAFARLFVWLVTRVVDYSPGFDRNRIKAKKKGPRKALFIMAYFAYL